MTKFGQFQAALRKLCQQHRVALAPTQDGGIGVWDLQPEDEPVTGLVDCVEEHQQPEARQMEPLPDLFATGIEASKHPGYITQELSERLARAAQQIHPGSEIVPIASSSRIRAWALVKPVAKST